MVFTSLSYLFFLPIVFGVTYSIPQSKRVPFLLAASYLFYSAWKAKFLLVIVCLTAFDYLAGCAIESRRGSRAGKMLWIASLAANLGALFVFKYLGFFTQELNRIGQWIYLGSPFPATDLILPVGISFHTFQAMSYTTDVYLGHERAERNFWRFALFIAWFPQMVAGPIERASTLLPQLKRIEPPRPEQIREGLAWILWGVLKKLVVATNLSLFLDPAFSDPSVMPSWYIAISVYAFAFQIYCDFSGYTDIAKGSSLLFGVRLSENFHQPFLARGFPDFWTRWHISLSSWFFEYVYYPICRRYPEGLGPWVAVLAVFFLSGIWHGANWTFVIWGLLNGAIYCVYVALGRWKLLPEGRWSAPLLVALNFQLVSLCWIFFRANTLASALKILNRYCDFFLGSGLSGNLRREDGQLPLLLLSAGVGLGLLLLDALSSGYFIRRSKECWFKALPLFMAVFFTILACANFTDENFIYFQF